VVLVAGSVLLWVPLPTAVQLRDWATSLGPWFPAAFLAGYVVITVFPFPRTAFTLAAGLLFGPALGATLAVLASTTSAVIALLGVRATGWRLSRRVSHPTVEALNARLQQRGWPAIVSLRLIPAVPFSVLNYAAGASAVRFMPYLAATFVGLLPGTLAVVILGDAMTGRVSPMLVAVSLATAGVGVSGLALEVRTARRRPGRSAAHLVSDGGVIEPGTGLRASASAAATACAMAGSVRVVNHSATSSESSSGLGRSSGTGAG
jgi:uncharacterized membrane protein YdjX (TVP38/TMEM64 family)